MGKFLSCCTSSNAEDKKDADLTTYGQSRTVLQGTGTPSAGHGAGHSVTYSTGGGSTEYSSRDDGIPTQENTRNLQKLNELARLGVFEASLMKLTCGYSISPASPSGSAQSPGSDHSTAKGGVSSQQNSSSTMSEETESQTQQSVNHNAATDPGSLSVDGSHSDGTGGAPSDSSAYSKCETSSGVPATNLSSVGGVEAVEESASRSAA